LVNYLQQSAVAVLFGNVASRNINDTDPIDHVPYVSYTELLSIDSIVSLIGSQLLATYRWILYGLMTRKIRIIQHQMKTLVSFATRWGPQFGGINSFNQDLLKAFAAAFSQHIQTFCIVLDASQNEIDDALNHQVNLISLSLGSSREFSASFAVNAWQALSKRNFTCDLMQTVWLGHDRITGEVALTAAKDYGGRSVLIKHMSYDHYESFSENSALAAKKNKEQQAVFNRANVVMAVGPLLRDALADLLDRPDIPMLVPGLPDNIKVKAVNKTFCGFISGRLSDDAKKIKQGHLGVAAFARAIHKADADSGLPDALRGTNEPKLTLRGVDFERHDSEDHADAETELKMFAQKHAGRVIRMNALAFTTDRHDLFDDLRSSSVAMMPSWHEGFGLVGWEAIAAGVPLIVSKKSGLYRLLSELNNGLYSSLVYPIDIAGSITEPFFQEKDQEALAQKIIEIAKSPEQAKGRAQQLREELLKKYRWPDCAATLAEILGWKPEQEIFELPADARLRPPERIAHEKISNGVLEMPSPTWKPKSGLSNSWLLRAEEGVIPFDPAREPFLDEQLQWAHSGDYLPNDVAVKTTLDSLINSTQPVCLIIDYAETRQQQLLELIKALLAVNVAHSIRILLLARDGGEWWNLLAAKDSACEILLSGMATTGPYQLPRLHDNLESRQAAYRRAVAAFAKKLGVPESSGIPKLEEEHFGHPLYLQMAALLALHGEQPGSAESVARSLIGHERRYWQRVLLSITEIKARQEEYAALLMTLATLSNGLSTVRDSEALWSNIGEEKAVLKPLFNALAQLYPARQGVDGFRPDLLGEALVAQSVLSSSGNQLLNTVLGSKNSAIRLSSLTVLARILRNREELSSIIESALSEHFVACADELITVIVDTPSPFTGIAERVFTNLPSAKKYQACGVLSKHFEYEIIPLIDLAVLVAQAQLSKFDHNNKNNHVEYLASRAAALMRLSVSLSWQGSILAAAEKAEQALNIREKLAKVKPERFEPDLAASLSNLASYLSALGRIDEAEVIGKQALNIRERLAKAKPERFEPDWAASLSNYANRLSELGRTDEAVVIAKQALDISEKLAKVKPELFDSDWARSLGNYANRLNELGRTEEAEVIAKQALAIHEKLAKAKPERFEPDWASSLGNYGAHLSELGRTDEAEEFARQALAIHERLAKAKPERFEPDWASSLSNYGNRLNELGRFDEAEAIAKQAVMIHERLAKIKPERYEPNLITSLGNYAIHLSELGRNGEALQVSERAMCICEKLVKAKPERFESDWAMLLGIYVGNLNDVGRSDEVNTVLNQIIVIYEKLTTAWPKRFEYDLKISKVNADFFVG
jgi:tetratricopeptide (TPR) repeat protein